MIGMNEEMKKYMISCDCNGCHETLHSFPGEDLAGLVDRAEGLGWLVHMDSNTCYCPGYVPDAA